jgi:hypothetical protein
MVSPATKIANNVSMDMIPPHATIPALPGQTDTPTIMIGYSGYATAIVATTMQE